MGQWNAERWAPEAWRAGTETVGQMQANRWEVTSRCEVCGLAMRVDLNVIVQVKGPRVSLWNRRAPCRRIGCEGKVRFWGRPPIVPHPFALEAERARRG
jgi:hypothetical protein